MGKRRTWAPLALATCLAGATWATSAWVARDAAAQLPAGRPWLGVALDANSAGAGVRVGHIVRRSPADLAGLREGDRLLEVGGLRVAHGADVIRAVAASAVGATVDVVFERASKEQHARVALVGYPSADDVMRMDLVGAAAPGWRDLEPVKGAFPASLGAVRGRVVLLDFWATWCVPCRIVIPKLGALQARYGAQGLSVLGVSTEDAQDVALFAQRAAMPYAVAIDKHAETTRSYGVASLPTLVVIDRRGVVRDVSIGYDPNESARLEGAVQGLLAEPAPAD